MPCLGGMRDGQERPFMGKRGVPHALTPPPGWADCDGRAESPPTPFFFVSRIEHACWKLGAPLRSPGVRSLVRIAFFDQSFLGKDH